MNDRLPLFVFGTLRYGECNHHLLEGNYERMVSAELPGFSRIHPLMIVLDEDDTVEGELYFIDPLNYEETIQSCDRLEGISPGKTAGENYRRIRTPVETEEGAITAWVYVHPETPEN